LRQLIIICIMVTGLLVFAVLVGFVNDAVAEVMHNLNSGGTKVATSEHTLILGWNESTVRCVCQIAFLRKAFIKQNETWARSIFRWRRVKPSTPVAANPVVVMCNTMAKEEMDRILGQALLERGISPKRTRIGRDVICRIGDPTDPHDLLRVGAHRAKRILTMMTVADAEEEKLSQGTIKGGATLRALLALRRVTGMNVADSFWDGFRCFLQLDSASDCIDAARFHDPSGREVVQAIELRAFVNSLMFNCTTHPGMSSVFMELLNFDGMCFRSKDATKLGIVGRTIESCTLLWKDAVLVGVANKHRPLGPTSIVYDEGLACYPQRVITKDDRVIFVALNAFPAKAPPSDPTIAPLVTPKPQDPWDILVCGWRREWTEDAKRLKARVSGMTSGVPSGSWVVFLNKLDFACFEECMDAAGFDKKENEKKEIFWDLNGVFLRHLSGDAADLETLRTLMLRTDGNAFESAVVLGTMAGVDLPAASRDMRVLSTMILLRKAHHEYFPGQPLHVVGENAIDSTSSLALVPTGKVNQPDFVNTQAIYARVLTQALAYPVMQPAIAQLFHKTPGSPQLKLLVAGQAIIPLGPATFADCTRTVARQMPGAICLGYLKAKDVEGAVFAPSPHHRHDFEDGDKLIVIHREDSATIGGPPTMPPSSSDICP